MDDEHSRNPAVLVTGAAGMLGDALVPTLVRHGYRVLATDIDVATRHPWGLDGPAMEKLDVRDGEAVRDSVERTRPGIVIHLAAETSLERCEVDPAHAVATNATATRHVADACRREGVFLVYVSTAGVFDGEHAGAYDEDSAPNPINWYGRTKLDGERVVRETGDDHYIVRAGWMVGRPAGKDHKFIGQILHQISSGARVVRAVADKFGSPTYAPDFSTNLIGMLRQGAPSGLYHAVSECVRSRYDVAVEVVDALGRPDVSVEPVSSSYFADSHFAPRPTSEVLSNAGLRRLGRNAMRPWPEPLPEYLEPWTAVRAALRPKAEV